MLTSYDGNTITYDTIGNPLTDGTWTYTWQNGRELASMSNGATTWSYTYDANGMRKTRTNGTDTYTYLYNGSQLVQMSKGSDTLQFYYSANGTPVAVKHNGTLYYYVTTLQGDVLMLLDSAGNELVTYTYDAWGNLLEIGGTMASTLGTLNPLTYRSYTYDHETRLYYLQTRYYNPEVGRFISADTLVATGQGMLGNNMFAYCLNNPVCRKDISGATSVACHSSEDVNHADDDKEFAGGNMSNGNNTNAPAGNVGKPAQTTTPDSQNSANTKIETNNYAGTSGKTEVHHVVEQCQTNKSGFSKSQIQSSSNTVVLDYELHRSISGYYSSKPDEFGGLRVRDWLAGQSFEAQTAFGWQIINRFYYQQCI